MKRTGTIDTCPGYDSTSCATTKCMTIMRRHAPNGVQHCIGSFLVYRAAVHDDDVSDDGGVTFRPSHPPRQHPVRRTTGTRLRRSFHFAASS